MMNGYSFTPLDRAAMCTQPEGAAAEGVRLLLAAGADATAKNEYGITALHLAARYGPDDPSLAGLLMGARCDPAAKDRHGKPALAIAKEKNKPRMAALLEAAAADPEAARAPFRAEFDALRQLVADLGLEAGLAVVASEDERLAAVRAMEPRYDEMVERGMERARHALMAQPHALHAAAGDGRLADLAAGLTAKDAAEQLGAGTPCRAPP